MKSLIYILAFSLWVTASTAYAQANQDLIPTLDSAESVFRTALQAYEDEQYSVAERLFGVASDNYDLHKKTTAALLMRGKALYLAERFDEATLVLNTLKRNFPTSRYIDEADQVLGYIEGTVESSSTQSPTFRLGIALPLNDDAVALTQQLFNGIHLAVDEHNTARMRNLEAAERLPRIVMVFRDTNNDATQTRLAIRELVRDEQVDAIIGPLFSTEAIAAAEEAEASRTVLIAPLATAEEVSNNRQYVFQANPTIEVRGKLMARFVVRGLGIESVGVLTDDTNPESRGMVRGFVNELHNLDIDPEYEYYLSNTRSWFRLSDEISRDSLAQAKAVYLPINGANASTVIGGALGSLDRMGLGSRIRVIGNKEWHSIANVSLASNYSTTYTNDFHVVADDSLSLEFQQKYVGEFNLEPIRLSYSGYDVAKFLTVLLERTTTQSSYPLNRLIREAGLYEGLGNRIDFTNSNVNEAMFYHRYRDGLGQLLR